MGEDLISLVVFRIECYSSCNVLKVENLDAIECGVVGVFIAQPPKVAVGRLLSHGAPNSPVRHRTLSGAPATSAGRWVLTVGALTGGASGLSGGAPDRYCRLSGAPSGAALTLARTVAHLMRWQSTVAHEVVVAPLAHRTVRCDTRHCPVHHRTVR
jgi:hypothetical protein